MKQWVDQLLRRSRPAHLQSGQWGEKEAARFLRSRGWKIVGKRVRTGKHGEIDIIAKGKRMLIFVEVKTRKNEKYGRPFAAVNRKKRRNLCKAAVIYLKKQQQKPEYIRFDVVEVIGKPPLKFPLIRHIENAFQLDLHSPIWW